MSRHTHEEIPMATIHILGATVTDAVMDEARREMRIALDGGFDYIDAAYKVAVNGWIGLTHQSEGDAPRNEVFYRLVNEFRPAGVEVA
jgi:hypothetical protein